MSNEILTALYEVLQTRKNARGEESYVASLYERGAAKIAAKIAEEAEEVNVEGIALDGDSDNEAVRENLRQESADLLFHLMVMLSYHDMHPDEVLSVLDVRFGTSGHAEKAAR